MNTARPQTKRATSPAFALSLGLALFLVGATSAAQEGAVTSAEPSKTEPKAEPISVEEIGVASQRAQRIFKEMSEGLGLSEKVEKIQQDLPGLRTLASDALGVSRTRRAQDPSVLALDLSTGQLKEALAKLETTQSSLGERAAQVSAQIENARKERGIWQATRSAALEAEVDPAVVAPIDDVERSIKQALKQATERQAAIVELQSEVASFSESLSAELETSEALRLTLVGQVFQRDQPPLWSGDFWALADVASVGERLGAHWDRQLESLKGFYEKERESIGVHLILTLLLAGMLFYLRPIAQKIFSGTEEIANVRAIFDGPLVLTALISFLVAFFWATSDVAALGPFLSAATLIPAVILLRRIVGPPLYLMLNALILLFIIRQLSVATAPLAVLGRLVFLLEITVAILVILYLRRPARLADIPAEALQSPIFRAIAIGLRVALLAAICALVAEVTGYGGLAHLLDRAVATSANAGAVFYGAVLVADGLVTFALRVRPLNQLGMVRRYRLMLQRRAERALIWIGWLAWIALALSAAELLEPLENYVVATLSARLPLPEVEITVGDLFAGAFTFWAALLTSRFLRFVLNEDVFTRTHLKKGQPYAISTLLHYVILVVGFVLACMALGFDLNRFTLLAGAFGVGIGFGLQSIVNNFVSGIILLTERPVEVGDTITLGDIFGTVERIGIRSSRVRTFQGAEIIVPNADLIVEQVTNWTLSDRRRRMEIPIGVAYGSDPRRVMEILKSTASAVPQVLETPEPIVLFNGFGDSSLDFEVRAWTDDFDAFLQIRSDVCVAISDALDEAEIVIPFPQRDLHVKEISASATQQPVMTTSAAGRPHPAGPVPEGGESSD